MAMKIPFGQQPELSVGEEAARWLCELRDGDREQQTAFFAWLRRSPRHVEEFLFASAMWRKLERFGQSDPARIERLIAAAQAVEQSTANIVALRSANEGPRENLPTARGRLRWQTVSIAAAVVLALGAASTLLLFSSSAPRYTTAVGEQRIVRLADGSRVDLNTRSRIVVRFSEHARDVRLLEGEALFTVARDPARPFRVDAGDAVIQAVGTQFNVYRYVGGTRVSVLEGAVQIADGAIPVKLAAGEQAQIKPNGQMIKHKPENIADAAVWREHRLVFRADRLEDVVAEVNRYTTRPIRVEGDARNMQLTAIFDADDPDSLIRFLRPMHGLSVESLNGETVIHAR